MDNIPFISREWLVDINIREKTVGKNYNSKINPTKKKHEDHETSESFRLFYICLEISPASCHEDVTRVMNDKDHNASSNLIAHHRKEDKTYGHKMMQHPFVIFSIIFLYNHQLKH